jgi:hypothetical protein
MFKSKDSENYARLTDNFKSKSAFPIITNACSLKKFSADDHREGSLTVNCGAGSTLLRDIFTGRIAYTGELSYFIISTETMI